MQHNADKRQNVALYWNGEREEKHFQSHMLLFVFYGDIQGNTDNKHNVALCIQIEKKKSFFAKLQTKVQNPEWKEVNVLVTKLSLHNSNKHKQE